MLFEIIRKFAQNVFEIKGKFNINILIQNLSEDKKNEIKSILDKLETEIESIRNAIR